MGAKKQLIEKSGRGLPIKGFAAHPPLLKTNPSEDKYFKDIVATLREPLVVLDADLRVRVANRSFYKFFKVKAGETVGRPIYELGNRQWDIPGLHTLLESILPPKAGLNDYEVDHDFQGIGRRVMLVNARRILRPPKKAQWILLAFEDITGGRRVEGKSRQSEMQLQSFLNAAPFPIAMVDVQGSHIEYWSKSAIAKFGYIPLAVEEWYQSAYPDPVYRAEVIERWKPALEKARLSDQAVNMGEYRITCRDGLVRICELYAGFQADRLIVTFDDITERKQAQERLSASEAEMRGLFAGLTDIVFICDTDGRNIKIAPTSPAKLLLPIEDLLGKSVHEILPKEQADFFVAKINEAIQTAKTIDGEYSLKMGDDLRWFTCSFSRLSEKSAILVVHDTTERMRTEGKLILANKELLFQNEEKEKRAAELVIANKELAFQNEEKEKRAEE